MTAPTAPSQRDTWMFHTAGQLVFGKNAAAQLGDVARRWGFRRLLVATDDVLVKAGVLDSVKDSLQRSKIDFELFTGGEPEPSMNAVMACATAARQCLPDALVAVGGGSNMDLAKAACIVLAHAGHPRDYAGDDQVPGPIVPLICLPTTAGTGSEVSFASVLTDTENKTKVGIISNFLRPRTAIIDPLLAVSCPPKVTAESGIDALTHAIEAYTAVDNESFPLPSGERSAYQGRHPITVLLAEKAIALIGKNLRRAVADGSDVEAREGMSLAATTAGMAFSNSGVAAVHALEYPLNAAVHSTHGAGNGLLLPYVMRFNLPERQAEFARIAEMLGEDTAGLNPETAAEKAIAAVEKLREDIGIPRTLRDFGVKEEQLRNMAEAAHALQRIMRVNPRTAAVDDLFEILRSAF